MFTNPDIKVVFGQFTRFAVLHLIFTALLMALLIFTFWPERATYYYVHTCGNQYCIFLHTDGHNDPQVTAPLKLDDATKLTDLWNEDLQPYAIKK